MDSIHAGGAVEGRVGDAVADRPVHPLERRAEAAAESVARKPGELDGEALRRGRGSAGRRQRSARTGGVGSLPRRAQAVQEVECVAYAEGAGAGSAPGGGRRLYASGRGARGAVGRRLAGFAQERKEEARPPPP